MTETDYEKALRDIAPGFISFYIKATDNDKNVQIHTGFKAFARDECAGDYTKALEKLMSYYQDDAKFESMWENIKILRLELDELRFEVQDLKQKPQEQKHEQEEETGTF